MNDNLIFTVSLPTVTTTIAGARLGPFEQDALPGVGTDFAGDGPRQGLDALLSHERRRAAPRPRLSHSRPTPR